MMAVLLTIYPITVQFLLMEQPRSYFIGDSDSRKLLPQQAPRKCFGKLSIWTCIPQDEMTFPPARRRMRITSCSFSISAYSSLGEFSSTLGFVFSVACQPCRERAVGCFDSVVAMVNADNNTHSGNPPYYNRYKMENLKRN